MLITVINQTKVRIPRAFLLRKLKQIRSHLLKRLPSSQARLFSRKKEIVLVFVSSAKIQSLNKKYRFRDLATDVLSFEVGHDHIAGVLGELVLCPAVLQQQAHRNGHSFRDEILYLLIHGILHLLGFDHEKSKAAERQMLGIQDEVFARVIDKP